MMAHRQCKEMTTQDSRWSVVDVLEFDMSRGSDEELIPVDSPGSEVEFGESIAAPVSEKEFPDVLESSSVGAAQWMMWIRATSFDKGPR